MKEKSSEVTFSVPDLQDPDWETYEDVEPYVSEGDARILRRLLPQRLWWYLFAPTEVDEDTIRQRRAEVADVYSQTVELSERFARRLLGKSQVSRGYDSFDSPSNLLGTVGIRRYPASAPALDKHSSLREYIESVEQAIAREREVLQLIEQLSAGPAAGYLKEEERADLEELRQFLQHSVEQGTAQRERAARHSRELATSLRRLDEWEQNFERLAEQAEPYLQFDAYLPRDELLDEIESLTDQISQAYRLTPTIKLVSPPSVDRLRELEEELSQLRDRLKRSRSKYASERLDEFEFLMQETLDNLDERLKSPRENGSLIDDPGVALDIIDSTRRSIEAFRDEPYIRELSDSQLDVLSSYESELDSQETFILEKNWFDSELESFAQQVDELRSSARPYLEYSRYLTRPTAAELSNQIEQLRSELRQFTETADFSILSGKDQDRASDLVSRVFSIKSHLNGYNEEFVSRRRNECEEFFTDIGASNLSLTPEQERAVIRNDVYNQVVAAAGTGKTLTLTTRVAYLVRKQGIDPERILVVTYTNEATEEMRTRLADHFGITDIEIQTVHAFGRGIIQEAEDEYVDSVESNQIENFVDQQIRAARENETSAFLDHYYEFLVHYDDVYYEEADFETKKEYVQARADQEYTTLKGEEVKSRAEKLIADFLFTYQIDYRYEDLATWADTAADKKEYAPDFYLPAHDIYIEHWGIDESGSVAEWFSWSSEEYREKMQWARDEFAESEATLVETYEFEHEAGRVKQALTHRLSELGVDLDRMSFDELVDAAFDYEQREGWIKSQFASFIENAKLFDMKPEAIDSNLSEANPRQYHFGRCGIQLLQQYTLYLVENELIDYADMIHDAVDLVQQRPREYRDRYDHILVDEFQDIGKGKLDLIQALTGPDAARLFAVGDDWQSIFSFQGAVTQYFTRFAEYFGEPARTDLTRNFRSPAQVIDAGNDLIQANQNQLEKEVQAEVDHDSDPRMHTLRGYNFYDYVRRVRRYTLDLVQQYLSAGAAPSDIMVLCRFDSAVSYLDEIKSGLHSQEIPYVGKSDQYRGPDGRHDDGVAVYSLYQAKGREAEHVIVVHVAEGPYGFPPDNRDNELVDPVQPMPLGGLEEERRAFYVAITRTERTLDLLTRAEKDSQFLDEISEFVIEVDAGQVEPLDDVGERMSVTVKVDKLQEPWNKQHQKGFLADRYGGSARFVSWESNDPPTLEQGEWYELSGVRVGEYKDEKELVLTSDCDVDHLLDGPEELNVPALD